MAMLKQHIFFKLHVFLDFIFFNTFHFERFKIVKKSILMKLKMSIQQAK